LALLKFAKWPKAQEGSGGTHEFLFELPNGRRESDVFMRKIAVSLCGIHRRKRANTNHAQKYLFLPKE